MKVYIIIAKLSSITTIILELIECNEITNMFDFSFDKLKTV